MKPSDIFKGLAVGTLLGAAIFALNRLLGVVAPLSADATRAATGGAIGAVAIAAYMPLRRRIRAMIENPKSGEPET